MKQLFTFVMGLLMAFSLFAQPEDDLFLTFEFMRVDEDQSDAYMNIERFWSGIHQERANAGEIIGWDLWSLQPGGEDQGYQYLTVTLYSSYRDMLAGGSDYMALAKAAYADMSDEDLEKTFDATSGTRDLAVRLFMQLIDETDGDFDMPLGTMATIDIMKALNDDYEDIESAIFKPSHQDAVDFDSKGSWSLLRVILPAGSDRYTSHVTVNMYKDVDQFASWSAPGGGESSMEQDMAIEQGIASREMKKVYFAKLEMKVR